MYDSYSYTKILPKISDNSDIILFILISKRNWILISQTKKSIEEVNLFAQHVFLQTYVCLYNESFKS